MLQGVVTHTSLFWKFVYTSIRRYTIKKTIHIAVHIGPQLSHLPNVPCRIVFRRKGRSHARFFLYCVFHISCSLYKYESRVCYIFILCVSYLLFVCAVFPMYKTVFYVHAISAMRVALELKCFRPRTTACVSRTASFPALWTSCLSST